MTRVIKSQKVGKSNSLVDESPESVLDEGIQKEKRKKKKKKVEQGVSLRLEDSQIHNGSTNMGNGNSSSEIQKTEERGTQNRVVPTAAEESSHSVTGKKQKRKDKLKPDEQDNGHKKKKRKDKAIST